MKTPGIVLLTRDEAVADAVLATAAALTAPTELLEDVETFVRRWATADVVLVGGDCAAAVASAAPRRRGRVYVVGFDAEELGAWSAPIGAEVIPLPRGLASLSAAMSEDGGASSPVVAVVGGSGGVGASTLAAGLALAAARRGTSCALVDIDPLGGGLDLLLGAERTPGWRWPRLAGARGEVSDVRPFLPEVEGVAVVSMARAADAAPPSAEAVQAVLSSLARQADLVVLDTGRSPLPAARQQVRLAQPAVLVAGSDVRAVAACAETRRALDLAGARVVVRTRPGARVPPAMIADALDLPLLGVVPDDRQLARAALEGEPPGWRRGPWARAVEGLVEAILGEARDGDRS